MSRNIFFSRITIRTVKYIAKYHYYSYRSIIINNNEAIEMCLRCGLNKDWEHILLYEYTKDIINEFIDLSTNAF